MKKLFIFLAFTLLLSSATEAQVSFKPGLRGGANFAHFTKGDSYNYNSGYYDEYGNWTYSSNRTDYRNKTDFYVGFFGALHLTKYYTLQPEIDYSRQGAKLGSSSNTYDASYLCVSVVNKFTFNDKFNIHVGPSIDFLVDSNFKVVDPRFDLSFKLGAGYNFTKNFGIEARVKKGIIPVIDYDTNHTNVVFSVGGTYTFDIK